jgi:hypothetical protein
MPYQQTDPQNSNQQNNPPIVIGEASLVPVYTDGVVKINIVGDVIRLDLCNLTVNEQNQLVPVVTTKLCMSIAAFAKTAEIVEDYVNKLIQAGLIKKS